MDFPLPYGNAAIGVGDGLAAEGEDATALLATIEPQGFARVVASDADADEGEEATLFGGSDGDGRL